MESFRIEVFHSSAFLVLSSHCIFLYFQIAFIDISITFSNTFYILPHTFFLLFHFLNPCMTIGDFIRFYSFHVKYLFSHTSQFIRVPFN